MFAVQLLIPLSDNDSKRFSPEHHGEFERFAVERIGGLTLLPGEAAGVLPSQEWKFKRFRQRPKGAREWLARVIRTKQELFAHWPLLYDTRLDTGSRMN